MKERTRPSMKRFTKLTCAGAVILGILAAGAPAHAATTIEVQPTAALTGEQVTGTALKYDPRKNDNTNPYRIGYEGTLPMGAVWGQYGWAKSAYVMSQVRKGVSLAEARNRWASKTIVGEITVSFTLESSKVQVSQDLTTPEALQATYEELNRGTDFTNLMRVKTVTFNPETRTYQATFGLTENGEAGVKAARLDAASARPNVVRLSTPHAALTLKQSDFVPGTTLQMSGGRIEGSVSVAAMYVSQLPIVFTHEQDFKLTNTLIR